MLCGWLMRTRSVACLGVLVLCGSVACGRQAAPLPAHLPATVDVTSILVKVTNGDHQDWRNVRVRVNDTYACPPVDKIEQGQSATVKLIGCNAADGERFQPFRTAAVRVAVAAIQVDDTGEATATFR